MLRMQYIHCMHSLLKCSWPWLRTNRSFLQIILFVRQQLSEGKRKHPVESPGITNSPLSSQPPPSGFQLFIDGQALLKWQVFIEITVSLLEPMTKLPLSPLLSARTKSDTTLLFWKQSAHGYLLRTNWVSHSMCLGADVPEVMWRFPGQSRHRKLSGTRKKNKTLKSIIPRDFGPTRFWGY